MPRVPGPSSWFPGPQVALFALVMVASTAAAVATRNWEFVFHAAAVTATAGVVLWVRRSVVIGEGVLWGLVACAAMHMAGGLVAVPRGWPTLGPPVLYNLWLVPDYFKYDHLVHAGGFGLAAAGWWHALRGLAPSLRPTAGPMAVCWLAAQGCGALNEVAEFATVVWLERTNVGDFQNAMLDLVANAAGAGLVVVGIAWRARLRGGE